MFNWVYLSLKGQKSTLIQSRAKFSINQINSDPHETKKNIIYVSGVIFLSSVWQFFFCRFFFFLQLSMFLATYGGTYMNLQNLNVNLWLIRPGVFWEGRNFEQSLK
jgi:hypothetical protein